MHTLEPTRSIKVLIVEDSPVVLEFLAHLLNAEPGIAVVGTAASGEEALLLLETQKPDLITMDVNLPGMNGLETTRRIMETKPTPILLVTGNRNIDEVATSFNLMEIGALGIIEKPPGFSHPEHARSVRALTDKVKTLAEVPVIRRWPPRTTPVGTHPPAQTPQRPRRAGLVVIGASTGGPGILKSLLADLPESFPAPIAVVQHMSNGFIQSFAEWLDQACRLKIQVARSGENMQPGHVYIAPDGHHLEVRSGGRIVLSADAPENLQRPAIARLFRSAAESYGAKTVGILLSGMGADGAEELRLLKTLGALTLVQDEKSSIVFGMPKVAIDLGAASQVLSPAEMSKLLSKMA